MTRCRISTRCYIVSGIKSACVAVSLQDLLTGDLDMTSTVVPEDSSPSLVISVSSPPDLETQSASFDNGTGVNSPTELNTTSPHTLDNSSASYEISTPVDINILTPTPSIEGQNSAVGFTFNQSHLESSVSTVEKLADVTPTPDLDLASSASTVEEQSLVTTGPKLDLASSASTIEKLSSVTSIPDLDLTRSMSTVDLLSHMTTGLDLDLFSSTDHDGSVDQKTSSDQSSSISVTSDYMTSQNDLDLPPSTTEVKGHNADLISSTHVSLITSAAAANDQMTTHNDLMTSLTTSDHLSLTSQGPSLTSSDSTDLDSHTSTMGIDMEVRVQFSGFGYLIGLSDDIASS